MYDVHLIEEVSPQGGTHWLAIHPSLPGCHAIGETQEQAAEGLETARDTWLSVTERHGGRIPAPKEFPAVMVTYLRRAGYAKGETAKDPVPNRVVEVPTRAGA